MSTTQFAFSAAPIRKIKEVQFGILSPEEIVRIPLFRSFILLLTDVVRSPESLLCRQD